ncbi:class I glutamine amidotransferase-like protein [Serendipita vermifera]|nr:class I glutamine amidotransferase-like protein [Serendipita vermifera]
MPIPKILIYSATAGYRHESIPTAITALQNLGIQNNISFDATEDRSKFEDQYLGQFDALLFLSNSDEGAGKDAFQRYLDAGGNFIGIHGASACLFTTPFFNRTVGALFDYHPPLTNATIIVEDASHPSTSSLPSRWQVQDEVYNFRSDPRDVGAQVILSVDETSYVDNGTRTYNQGSPHPIAWYQDRLAGTSVTDLPVVGRSWYTSLGHLSATWEDETFLSHIMGGIAWTLASHTTRAFNSSGRVGSTEETVTQGTSTGTAK